MNVRAWVARMLRPLMSYGSLEERAFADALAQYNASGIAVNEHSALYQSAVWACVRVIAESLAMLPLEVIERSRGRREVLDTHAVAWMLNHAPNAEMPAFRFRETITAHALVWGNGYGEIERDLAGRPAAVHLLTPDRVRPTRRDGVLEYQVHQPGGGVVVIPARDMLHIAGMGWDGLQGYSVVHMARQSLGLNAATETFAAAFFGNGMQLGTVYTTEAALKEDQVAALRKQLEEIHRGSAKAFRAALLTHGLKPGEPPMPLKDAQFIEGRRFGVLEICRWFRVPPHLVMELERATHSNVEQEQLAFVMHCLLPWASRIEAEINLKLFGRNQQARQGVKHNFDGLLRGDLKSRYEAYRIAREGGWLNANEIRALEDTNGIGEDGDLYLVPANMTTPERLSQPVTATPAPPPEDPGAELEDDPAARLQAARAHMRLVRTDHASA